MLALVLAAALAAPPAALGPEVLKTRFEGTRSLHAELLQVKEGRFWARPFQSRIHLEYTPERIVWKTVAPVRTTVVIEGTRLTVTGPDGQEQRLGAAAADPRLAAMLRFIRSLIALDLAAIERDFDVRYDARELVATPRPTSELALFQSIRLRFDDRIDPVELELTTATERTRLTFEKLVRDPPPAAAAPERR